MKQFYSRLKGILLTCFLGASFASFSQNVGINSTGAAPAASAGLDVNFSNKGVLIPNVNLLSLTDVATIGSPAESLLIYNKNAALGKGYYYWDGFKWVPIAQFGSGTTSTGNLGLGTTTPVNRLSINGTNPLALHGIQGGTNTDSVLTIKEGVIKGIPSGSILASTSSAWNLIGNSNLDSNSTAGNFVGSTNNQPLRFRTNNTLRMQIQGGGNVAIGSSPTFTSGNPEKFLVDAGTTNSFNLISAKGTKDGYLQLNVQNRSAGVAASSDVVASNNTATESANFIDMGINSTGNTSTGVLGGPNTAYLYSTGGDLSVGNGTAGEDLLLFTTGAASSTSSERIRIKENGRVGIGTTITDSAFVNINAGSIATNGGYPSIMNLEGSRNSYLQFNVQNNSSGNKASTDIVATANNGTEKVSYIDMGINSGSYASGNNALLNDANTAYIYANGAKMYIGNAATNQPLIFFTNSGSASDEDASGAERMRILSTGEVGIGTTTVTSGVKLEVNGNIKATNVTYSSDRRLKKYIKGLNYGLKELMALQPVTYYWKDAKQSQDKQIGLIAQEARKIIPEIVVGNESKEMLGVNYTELVPVLINAIKEQQKQIEELKQKVTALEKK
ncbi:tail fiber domain-containing protein [Desertivirga arenae]|uniref:tail fiber domain-containing protein n=1 Tax=Desertivirga arenae TaxID=2810309 RepID=UPI001A96197F|nr:tail fiber domain-containing protein [Pedobacter sp. SYSU D00823]